MTAPSLTVREQAKAMYVVAALVCLCVLLLLMRCVQKYCPTCCMSEWETLRTPMYDPIELDDIRLAHVMEKERKLEHEMETIQKKLALQRKRRTALGTKQDLTRAVEERIERYTARGRSIYGDAWDNPVDGNMPIKELLAIPDDEVKSLRAEAEALLKTHRDQEKKDLTDIMTPRTTAAMAKQKRLEEALARSKQQLASKQPKGGPGQPLVEVQRGGPQKSARTKKERRGQRKRAGGKSEEKTNFDAAVDEKAREEDDYDDEYSASRRQSSRRTRGQGQSKRTAAGSAYRPEDGGAAGSTSQAEMPLSGPAVHGRPGSSSSFQRPGLAHPKPPSGPPPRATASSSATTTAAAAATAAAATVAAAGTSLSADKNSSGADQARRRGSKRGSGMSPVREKSRRIPYAPPGVQAPSTPVPRMPEVGGRSRAGDYVIDLAPSSMLPPSAESIGSMGSVSSVDTDQGDSRKRGGRTPVGARPPGVKRPPGRPPASLLARKKQVSSRSYEPGQTMSPESFAQAMAEPADRVVRERDQPVPKRGRRKGTS